MDQVIHPLFRFIGRSKLSPTKFAPSGALRLPSSVGEGGKIEDFDG